MSLGLLERVLRYSASMPLAMVSKHLVRNFGLRLAILVMIYLGWLVEAHLHIYDRLVCLSQPLPDNPDFLSHRLLGGLTEATNTCFWLHRGLLRKSLS